MSIMSAVTMMTMKVDSLIKMSELSAFQKYWHNLKEHDPVKYYERLKINRDRVRKIRRVRYSDKDMHEAYKKKQRDKYAAKNAR